MACSATSFLSDAQPISHRWAIILAGGDRGRLPWTQRLTGDERPMFAPQRVVTVAAGDREIVSGSEAFAGTAPLFVQPENRGTAPAILGSLLAVQRRDPLARVALFPSDRFFANKDVLQSAVTAAFLAIRRRPELIVLLGIAPDAPSTRCGWIRPGRAMRRSLGPPLFQVDEFIEKPSTAEAEELFAQGCLWNSSVVIGSAASLLRLAARALPDLDAFHCIGSRNDSEARLYSSLPTLDFLKSILGPSVSALTVLPLRNAGWTSCA